MQRERQMGALQKILSQLSQLFERNGVQLPYELKIALVYSLQYAHALSQYQASMPMRDYLTINRVLGSPELKTIKGEILFCGSKYEPVFQLNLLFSHPQIQHNLLQLKQCLLSNRNCSEVLRRYQSQLSIKEMKRIYRILNSDYFKLLMGKGICEEKEQLIKMCEPFSIYFSHIKADTQELQNCLKQGKGLDEVMESYEDKMSYEKYEQIREVLDSQQLERRIFEWQIHKNQLNQVKSIFYENEAIDKNTEQVLVSLSYGFRLEDIGRFKNKVSARQYKYIKKMCLSEQFEKYLCTLQKGRIFDQMFGKICYKVKKLRQFALKMDPYQGVMDEYSEELKRDEFCEIKQKVESSEFQQHFYNPNFKVNIQRNFELQRSLWKLQEKGIKLTEQIERIVVRAMKGQELSPILQKNQKLSMRQKKTIMECLKAKKEVIRIKRKLTMEEERQRESNMEIVYAVIRRSVLQKRAQTKIGQFKNIYNFQIKEKFKNSGIVIEKQEICLKAIKIFSLDRSWSSLLDRTVNVEKYYQRISVFFHIVLEEQHIKQCINISKVNQILEQVKLNKNSLFCDLLQQSLNQVGVKLTADRRKQLVQFLMQKENEKKKSTFLNIFSTQSSGLVMPRIFDKEFSSNLTISSNAISQWKRLKLWKQNMKQPPENIICSLSKDINMKQLIQYTVNDYFCHSSTFVNLWFKVKAENAISLNQLNINISVAYEGEGQNIDFKISERVNENSILSPIESLKQAHEIVQKLDETYWDIKRLKGYIQVIKDTGERSKVLETIRKYEYYIRRQFEKQYGLPKMSDNEQQCKQKIEDLLKKQFLNKHAHGLKQILGGLAVGKQEDCEQIISKMIQDIMNLAAGGENRYMDSLEKMQYLKQIHHIAFSKFAQDYLRLQDI